MQSLIRYWIFAAVACFGAVRAAAQVPGAVDEGFRPELNGVVHSLAIQADGKILVVENNAEPGGPLRSVLRRLNVDGTLDPGLHFEADGVIHALAPVEDGMIWVGGGFREFGGEVRKGIARINANGSLDPYMSFWVKGDVRNIIVEPYGAVLLGGDFTDVGGQQRLRLAFLESTGTVMRDFNPGANGRVSALALQADGKIVVGGDFSVLGGQSIQRIGRVNWKGVPDSEFNAMADGSVSCLVMQPDGKILVAGEFGILGGQARAGLGRLNSNGSLDVSFAPAVNGVVSSIALQSDGKLLVGGDFTSVGGQARAGIARLRSDGTLDPSFNPGVVGEVGAIGLQGDGKVLVGGDFQGSAGEPRRFIARMENDPGDSSLTYANNTIDWQRPAGAPEVEHVDFSYWSNGQWSIVGEPVKVSGGWRRENAGATLNAPLRARGRVAAGRHGASRSFIEEIVLPTRMMAPPLAVVVNGSQPLAGGAGLKFGSVEVGQPASPQTLTFTNLSETNVAGIQLQLGGTHGGDFALSALEKQTLAPGESTTFSVDFTPGKMGGRTGLITITSSSPSQVVQTISLSGVGAGIDPGFTPRRDLYVESLAVQADGRILVGFNPQFKLGSTPFTGILRMTADGGTDSSFKPKYTGLVDAILVQPDGKILAGGAQFPPIGGAFTNALARLNADGALDSSFLINPVGSVRALAMQADGKILFGGSFSQVLVGSGFNQFKTVNLSSIGRILANGQLDGGFNPGANGAVSVFAVQADGKILVGGSFSTLGGQVRSRIGRLNANGTVVAGFNPGADNEVSTMVVQPDGKILVGGNFTTLGGQPRLRLARLNTDGSLDSSFNVGADRHVRSLVLQADGGILVGGEFTTLGGASRNRIARLNSDGSLDDAFDPGVSGLVNSLALQADGKILVGGNFSAVGGEPDRFIARLENEPAFSELTASGTTQMDWQRGGSAPEVEQVEFSYWNGSAWVAVGAPVRVSGGWRASGLALPASASLRARGRAVCAEGNGSSSIIEQRSGPAVDDSPKTYLLDIKDDGNQSLAGASPVMKFGAVNVHQAAAGRTLTLTNMGSGTLTNLNVSLLGSHAADFGVGALESVTLAPGESMVLRVDFTAGDVGERVASISISGSAPFATRTIQLSGSGSNIDFGFRPAVSNYEGSRVFSSVVQTDGKILLCGVFPDFFGVLGHGVIRLNPDGTQDPSFRVEADDSVLCAAVQVDGKIVLGGDFTQISGQPRSRIARLNADGSLDEIFNPGAGAQVSSLLVQADGGILVAGRFLHVAGQEREGIARIEPDGSLDSDFKPDVDGRVISLAEQADGKILMAGDFLWVSSHMSDSVARLNPDGTVDRGFTIRSSGVFRCLAVQADGKILVGGDFTEIAGQSRSGIARIGSDGSLDSAFNPQPDGSVYSIAVQSDGKILLLGDFLRIGVESRTRLARLNASGTVDPAFKQPGPSAISLTLQADGKMLVGGNFVAQAGTWQNGFARLMNESGTSQLTVSNGNRMDWVRGGGVPLVGQVEFSYWDGGGWVEVATPLWNSYSWEAIEHSLPASGWVRARGRARGGYQNGSSSIIEQVVRYGSAPAPSLALSVDGGDAVDGSGSLEFGIVEIGETSEPRVITLTNTGAVPLAGLAIEASGPAFQDYVISGLETLTLAAGESTSISVRFRPGAAQLRMGTLTITSADIPTLPLTLGLSGFGAAGDAGFQAGPGMAPGPLAVQADGKTYVSNGISGIIYDVNELRRLNPDGSLDSGFSAIVKGYVEAIAVLDDGKILVGGGFTAINGHLRKNLALLNADGTVDTSFGAGADGWVYACVVEADGRILVAGGFSHVGGEPRVGIARINRDGTVDPGFHASAVGTIPTLVAQGDGKLLVAGTFIQNGVQTSYGLKRLNADGSLDGGFNAAAVSGVDSIAVQADGKIVVGGSFSEFGANARKKIARLHPDGSLDTEFNPWASDTVATIAIQADGRIIVGGAFSSIGGQVRRRIARLEPDGTIDESFNPGASWSVSSIALQADGKVLVHGGFSSLGGLARPSIGRLNNDEAISELVVTDGSRIDWLRGGSAPEVGTVEFAYRSGGGWVAVENVVRVAGGWRAEGLSLPAGAWVRARARVAAGEWHHSSSGLIEQVLRPMPEGSPRIRVVNESGTELVVGSADESLGQLAVSRSSSRTFRIHNDGDEALNLRSIRLSGLKTAAFSVSAAGTEVLAPGESTQFTVRFDPFEVGSASADVIINSDDPEREIFRFVISGTGALAAELVVERAAGGELPMGGVLDFGTASIGLSRARLLRVRNHGLVPLEIGEITISGRDAGSFTIVTMPSATPLAPGGEASVLVIFHPAEAGIHEATLSIPSNDPEFSTYLLSLAGSAEAAPPSGDAMQLTMLPGGNVMLSFQGASGAVYQVQRSEDLVEWTTLEAVSVGTDGVLGFVDEDPLEVRGFYRVVRTP